MVEKRNPDLLGIGVMKSGTSWIYRQLKHHPQVGIPRFMGKRCKEMHFIDQGRMTMGDYCRRFGRLQAHKVIEFTPEYICCPYAAEFIKHHFPNTKLIAVFRNPTDRAFSHYKDHLFYGRIPAGLSFLEAFHNDHPKDRQFCYSIKEKGRYGTLLAKWFGVFTSEQLKVMFYDDLVTDPDKFIYEVYEWVGVEPSWRGRKLLEKHVKKYNLALDGLKLEDKVRQEIVDFYKSEVSQMEDIVKRKLNWS